MVVFFKDVNTTEIKGVVAKSVDLVKAKEEDTANKLARALFRAVFTEEALRSCSLGGNKAHGTGSLAEARPALCRKAAEAIFSKCCQQ